MVISFITPMPLSHNLMNRVHTSHLTTTRFRRPSGEYKKSKQLQFQTSTTMCTYEVDPESEPYWDLLEKPPRIALTREEGKNGVLRELLEEIYDFIEVLQLPCVRTLPLQGLQELPNILTNTSFKWIVITSPEAASLFISAWRKTNIPISNLPPIACVGKATSDCLRAVGLEVKFIPSKATGKTLVKEFPSGGMKSEMILYPTSKKASGDIEIGLNDRGFDVVRVNTYSTEWDIFDDTKISLAKDTHIVTFASPSAVKAWVEHVGVRDDMIVACIGETSATAARKVGFKRVHYPDCPGIDGWMTAICEAMKVYQLDEIEREGKRDKQLLEKRKQQ